MKIISTPKIALGALLQGKRSRVWKGAEQHQTGGNQGSQRARLGSAAACQAAESNSATIQVDPSILSTPQVSVPPILTCKEADFGCVDLQ
jgi:hypothetical protein